MLRCLSSVAARNDLRTRAFRESTSRSGTRRRLLSERLRSIGARGQAQRTPLAARAAGSARPSSSPERAEKHAARKPEADPACAPSPESIQLEGRPRANRARLSLPFGSSQPRADNRRRLVSGALVERGDLGLGRTGESHHFGLLVEVEREFRAIRASGRALQAKDETLDGIHQSVVLVLADGAYLEHGIAGPLAAGWDRHRRAQKVDLIDCVHEGAHQPLVIGNMGIAAGHLAGETPPQRQGVDDGRVLPVEVVLELYATGREA